MSGSPRRCHARHEEDISGQFRVTVPDAEELDQLRTQGGVYRRCCDMGQNDTIGKIELNPLSSRQVIILITRMTFNCSTSCLMS